MSRGGASIVIARVASMSCSDRSASPGISRAASSGVAPQVLHQVRPMRTYAPAAPARASAAVPILCSLLMKGFEHVDA